MIIPAGSDVYFLRGTPWICVVKHGGNEYRIRVVLAFTPPPLGEIYESLEENYCPAVSGRVVEPDGWCQENTPSWALVLGFV